VSLIELEEAQERLLALVSPMPAEEVPIEQSAGRVLAGNLLAARTQPAADLSAMDGYAIAGSGPWIRIGESRAGAPFEGALGRGETIRISTGAAMPAGADRVLIQENAQADGDRIAATAPPPAGKHVRRRGLDFEVGQRVIDSGTRIGPAQIALAIAAGHGTLSVARRPRVAVLDSGSELAADPDRCGPYQVPASNGAMLAATLEPWVGACLRIGPVPDGLGHLGKALAHANEVDVLVASGGASVGDHDLVQQALSDWGARIDFWKVAIKPGKPLMVATREGLNGRQVILGLPGNPVSSFVTAFLFALPLIREAMGVRAPLPSKHHLIAGEALPPTGSRREFLRGVSNGRQVRLAGSQDSSALAALASANCLIDRAANATEASAGHPVEVFHLYNG